MCLMAHGLPWQSDDEIGRVPLPYEHSKQHERQVETAGPDWAQVQDAVDPLAELSGRTMTRRGLRLL